MTDFSTLSYTTLTSKIPTLSYTWSLKKIPLRAEPPRIGHYREYPPLPDLKTEKKLRGCQRGAYILVWHRVWIMKLLHGALPGLPLTQFRVVFDVSVENSWNKRNVWKGIRLFSCWKIPGRNLDFMSSNPFSNISLRLSRPFFVKQNWLRRMVNAITRNGIKINQSWILFTICPNREATGLPM